MKTITRILAPALLLVLTACAYTPQQVEITPKVQANNQAGNGQNIAISVLDQRPQKHLGNRSHDEDHNSVISVANDLSASIKSSAKAALIAQGFNVDPSLQADAEYHIFITQLAYTNTAEDSHQHTISLQAELKSELRKLNQFYKGQYLTKTDHNLGISPSAAKNTAIINEVLSKSLQSLLDDPKAMAFLLNK
ncbi:MAG: hypothetical protein HRU20_01280 [Pseudomonadales bacterium]|nr:hypothetical protein [Pseudomonadales bacterium]